MSRVWHRTVPIRLLAALMAAYKKPVDPGAGTPGYPDWPKVQPPPGATGRRQPGDRRHRKAGPTPK